MDGEHGDGHHFFSQGDASAFQDSQAPATEDGYGDFFSQLPQHPVGHLGSLDLNAQAPLGGHPGSFTGLLNSGELYGDPIPPRGGRSG